MRSSPFTSRVKFDEYPLSVAFNLPDFSLQSPPYLMPPALSVFQHVQPHLLTPASVAASQFLTTHSRRFLMFDGHVQTKVECRKWLDMSMLDESISSSPASSDLKAVMPWTWFGPRTGISAADQGPQASRESVGVSESIGLRWYLPSVPALIMSKNKFKVCFRITKARSREGPKHDMLASQRLVKFGEKYDWFGLLNLG